MEVEEEERWRIALAREEKAIGELGEFTQLSKKKLTLRRKNIILSFICMFKTTF